VEPAQHELLTISEHGGHAAPDGMQHLLAGAGRDAERVRDDQCEYVAEHVAPSARCWLSIRLAI
jgi:hypothetical protein